MSEEKEWVLTVNGEEIPVVPLEYEEKIEPRWEFYLRRGNRYYFRSYNAKLVIESIEDGLVKDLCNETLKYGEKYDLDFSAYSITPSK